jgi:hypothetical protein
MALVPGRRVTGKVQRVILRGKIVYVDGHVIAEPGYGENVRSWKQLKLQQRFVPTIYKSDDQLLQVTNFRFFGALFKYLF